eukprot:scaffold112403_cov78-Phaeocystis_antarctica.AAC.4
MESGSSSVRFRKNASPSAHESEAAWWLSPIVRSLRYGDHSRKHGPPGASSAPGGRKARLDASLPLWRLGMFLSLVIMPATGARRRSEVRSLGVTSGRECAHITSLKQSKHDSA